MSTDPSNGNAPTQDDPRGDPNAPNGIGVDLAMFAWDVQRHTVVDPTTHVVEEVVILEVVPTIQIAMPIPQGMDSPIGAAQMQVGTVPMGAVVRLRLTKDAAGKLGAQLSGRPHIETA